MNYRLRNEFHSAEVLIHVKPGDTLDRRRVRRIRRQLCGVAGCDCGDDLGRQGRQPDNGDLVLEQWSHDYPYRVTADA
jgi:hypothetical protein